MSRVYVISCSKTKQDIEAGSSVAAIELYISSLFKKSVEYVYSVASNKDKIVILSARHCVLNPDDKIQYYNETIKDKKLIEKKEWAEEAYDQLKSIDCDEFVFLCGSDYLKYLYPLLDKNKENYSVLMLGMGIGQRLKWLKENTNKKDF